jgi:hypothetical protein
MMGYLQEPIKRGAPMLRVGCAGRALRRQPHVNFTGAAFKAKRGRLTLPPNLSRTAT